MLTTLGGSRWVPVSRKSWGTKNGIWIGKNQRSHFIRYMFLIPLEFRAYTPKQLHPWNLTWKLENPPICNRKYIFNWFIFHCHVSFGGVYSRCCFSTAHVAASTCDLPVFSSQKVATKHNRKGPEASLSTSWTNDRMMFDGQMLFFFGIAQASIFAKGFFKKWFDFK